MVHEYFLLFLVSHFKKQNRSTEQTHRWPAFCVSLGQRNKGGNPSPLALDGACSRSRCVARAAICAGAAAARSLAPQPRTDMPTPMPAGEMAARDKADFGRKVHEKAVGEKVTDAPHF